MVKAVDEQIWDPRRLRRLPQRPISARTPSTPQATPAAKVRLRRPDLHPERFLRQPTRNRAQAPFQMHPPRHVDYSRQRQGQERPGGNGAPALPNLPHRQSRLATPSQPSHPSHRDRGPPQMDKPLPSQNAAAMRPITRQRGLTSTKVNPRAALGPLGLIYSSWAQAQSRLTTYPRNGLTLAVLTLGAGAVECSLTNVIGPEQKFRKLNVPPARDIVHGHFTTRHGGTGSHNGRIQTVLTHVEAVQREEKSSAVTPLAVAPGP
jgi:hypothetical protein